MEKEKKEKEEVEEKYLWNLNDIYSSKEAFEKDLKKAQEELNNIDYSNLKNNAQAIFNILEKIYKIYEILEKLMGYSSLSQANNIVDKEAMKSSKEIENLMLNVEKTMNNINYSILKNKDKVLLNMLLEYPRLQKYKKEIIGYISSRKYELKEKEQKLLSRFSNILSNYSNVYDILTTSNLRFENVKDSNNKEYSLTPATYSIYLKSNDQILRRNAFQSMHKEYMHFVDTIAEIYLNYILGSIEEAKAKKIKNILPSEEDVTIEENILKDTNRENLDIIYSKVKKDKDKVSRIYKTLRKAVDKNISLEKKFLKLYMTILRKNKYIKSGEKLNSYDLRINPYNMAENNSKEDKLIEYEDAVEIVLDALKVLGKDYLKNLKCAINSRWIDVYERKNKTTGGFNLGIYGVHPYILLNYCGTYSDMSTIAHELGHAMHSYYADSNNDIRDAGFGIMIAEVASTVNEILLVESLLKKDNITNLKKKELLLEEIQEIRATLFRQTMFSEFEERVHKDLFDKKILTSESLTNIYDDLLHKYFKNCINYDEYHKYEWARIPHFYTPFYVYKYATGITSSIIIAQKILEDEKNGKEDFKKKYIDMLKQGGSRSPYMLLKNIGVDLKDENTYIKAFEFLNKKIEMLKKLEEN